MEDLIRQIGHCTICRNFLPEDPKPVFSVSPRSKILIIGQAPGRKVQESGIPWDDQSGKELRRWLDVSESTFYDPEIFGIVPMGFCYPGTGKSGDLPPRPECAPTWHHQLLTQMPEVKLTLLIGLYAQKYYLLERSMSTLTENVWHFGNFLPEFFPLVHPSPRNRIWQKKHPWFESEVVPALRETVRRYI